MSKLFLLVIFSFLSCKTPQTSQNLTVNDWSVMPKILKNIVPPRFPKRIFMVNTEGSYFRQNCQAAIDKCHAEGGGRVVVSKGNWACNGSIFLKTNVFLEITEEATVTFSANPTDYLPTVLVRWEGTMCYNFSPLIYANGQKNIGVGGKGVLNGNTEGGWSAWKKQQEPDKKTLRQMGNDLTVDTTRQFGEGHFLRPTFIEFVKCENILLEDFTLKNTPFWNIHPVFSKNITIRRLKIEKGTTNDDGIDPDSSTDVLIEDCQIDTNDDPIAIKSGRDQDAWQRGNSANIIVRNCTVSSEVGNAFCIGSEMSGGVTTVFVDNYTVKKTDNGINFKANLDRGGYIKNVFIKNVSIDTCTRNGILFQMDYHSWRGNNFPPDFEGFQLENITINKVGKTGLAIRGVASKPIKNVRLKNVTVKQSAQARDLQYTEGVVFQ